MLAYGVTTKDRRIAATKAVNPTAGELVEEHQRAKVQDPSQSRVSTAAAHKEAHAHRSHITAVVKIASSK
jgi:hypothetical protein